MNKFDYEWGPCKVRSKLKKFEHVQIDWGQGSCTRGPGSLHGEFHFIMGNGRMGPPDQNDRQTPMKSLPSRNLDGGR